MQNKNRFTGIGNKVAVTQGRKKGGQIRDMGLTETNNCV